MDVILILILVIAIIQTAFSKLSKHFSFDLKVINLCLVIVNALLWICFIIACGQEETGEQTLFLLGAILGYGACVFVNHFIEDITLQDNTQKEEA